MAFVSVPVEARGGGFRGAAVSGRGAAARGGVAAGRRAPRMAAAGADVPDMAKRNTMNILLFGSAATVAGAALVPVGLFFVPKSSGGAGGGLVAKDSLGNDVVKAAYLKTHPAGSRDLVQGLKGDATWMIVNEAGDDLEFYALNAVCTHLGCVVPWNRAENKFMCPCHGSQYSKTGAVVRGPAPLPLALERVEENADGKVVLKSWGAKEKDFRTGELPWWNF